MSEWNFPTIIELADGTKCVRLEDFLKNDGYKELYEVAKGRIEQLQSERDEAQKALRSFVDKMRDQAAVFKREDLRDNSRWSIFNEGRAQALEKFAEDLEVAK